MRGGCVALAVGSLSETALYLRCRRQHFTALSETALYLRCRRQRFTSLSETASYCGGLEHFFEAGDLGLGVGLFLAFQGDYLVWGIRDEAFVGEFFLYAL